MRHYSKEDIAEASGENMYLAFKAFLTPETIKLQDIALMLGASPEEILDFPGNDMPEDVREMALEGLRWRREQLLKMQQAQFN
jgi:hypothetical protein